MKTAVERQSPPPNVRNRRLAEAERDLGKLVLKSKPVSLDVNLTTRCNLACRMCDVITKPWQIDPKTFEEIKALIPTLSHTTWQGGEVFVYPRFKELLDETHQHDNIVQSIYTNGLLLDDAWMQELIKGPKNMIFSIDGTTPEVYERIRVRSDFSRLMRKIELFRKYREKSRFPMTSMMNVVIMRSNFRRMDRFIPFAKSLGFDKIELGPVAGELGGENIFTPPDRTALEFVERMRPILEAQAREHGLSLFNRLPHPGMLCEKNERENFTEKLYCTLPWSFLYVFAGGQVLPHPACKEVVGRVPEQSLLEIWNGPGMREYRRRLVTGEHAEWCAQRHNWMELLWKDSHSGS